MRNTTFGCFEVKRMVYFFLNDFELLQRKCQAPTRWLEEILVSDEFMSTQMTPGVVAIVPAIFMDFFNFLFV